VSNAFMITLLAGVAPPVLKRLPAPDLEHLSVFSSRSREDGRDRYRLHVGYFDDESTAQALLERVRIWYPQAWAVAAGRYTVLERLPSLAAPIKEPAHPPVVPDVGLELTLEPAPSSRSMSEPQAAGVIWGPAPRLQPPLELLLAPALSPVSSPPAVLHTYKGEGALPRAPLAVSDWKAPVSQPKPKSKPRPASWLKRLTALHS